MPIKKRICLIFLFFCSIALSESPREGFSIQDWQKKDVDFWIKIYSHYSTSQGIIHDARYLGHVYEVVDLGRFPPRESSQRIKQLKKKWTDILLSVHSKQQSPENLNAEERRIFEMYRDIREPNKFLAATNYRRIRFQKGQKDSFKQAAARAFRYLPHLERVFEKENLPKELTKIPFIESSFDYSARSKVGASGIWQFLPSTGRLYLEIDDAVDERNDPVRSTEAAAQLLKQNYESLGSWPLAVIAYNHGRKGLMRAVRAIGSIELKDLFDGYHSKVFGFASRNYFIELLAVIELEKNLSSYFGNIEPASPLEYEEVALADYVSVGALLKQLKISRNAFESLNPSVLDTVYSEKRYLPAGLRIKLPKDYGAAEGGAKQAFLKRYLALPQKLKHRRQKSN